MSKLIAICILVCAAVPVCGQQDPTTAEATIERQKSRALSGGRFAAAACSATPIVPPATIRGTISSGSCTDILGLREDIYSVKVSAGQTLDIDFSSTSFETFLYVYLGNGTSIETSRISYLNLVTGGGTSHVTARHTFATAGTYNIEAESLWSGSLPTTLPWQGPYTLAVTLSGGTPAPTTSTSRVVPVVGHLSGAGGSVFRSDVKLFNPSGSVATGKMQFTPLGQSASSSDPVVSFNIAANAVVFYGDVYLLAYPGGSGAARVSIVRNDGGALLLDTSTYTALSDGGELAQSPTVLSASDYYTAGARLLGFLGKAGERANIFVATGSTDVTIEWTYRDAFGTANAPFARTYPHDSTTQISASSLLGFAPGANSSLQALIVAGSARPALSPVNNISNQGRWVDFRVLP
ncbi:MAG TPA: PPC domain-containing protein [Thermoanaerobaculia bacterium]|nr:PPC domain-containing protein [Thermoanaerobaculia bacterium]